MHSPQTYKLVVSVLGKCEVAARAGAGKMGRKKQPLKPGPAVSAAASAGQGRAQAHTDQCLRPGSWSSYRGGAGAGEDFQRREVGRLAPEERREGVPRALRGLRRQARFMGTDGEPVQLGGGDGRLRCRKGEGNLPCAAAVAAAPRPAAARPAPSPRAPR